MSALPEESTPTPERISAARQWAAEINPVFYRADLATWDSLIADDGRFIQVLVITTPEPEPETPIAPVAAIAFAGGELQPLSGAVDSGDRSVVHRMGPDVEYGYWTVVEQGDVGLQEVGVCHVFGRAGPLAATIRLKGATGVGSAKRVHQGVFGIALLPVGEVALEVVGLGDRLRGTLVVECDSPKL